MEYTTGGTKTVDSECSSPEPRALLVFHVHIAAEGRLACSSLKLDISRADGFIQADVAGRFDPAQICPKCAQALARRNTFG